MKTQKTTADPGMSDAAVQAKTGKTWAEWFAVLDEAGAMQMTHKEIAVYLHDAQHCPPWWSQMVTVGYERVRGLREKNQAASGYQVSVTRTLPVPVAELYQACADARTRKRWLPAAKYRVGRATANRSLRITWDDGTRVEVMFTVKGDEKSQVSVSHHKLADAGEVKRLRAYWSKALDRLKELLVES
jgi:uncharacterized protein YndB with AHSA1/START domain